MKLIVDGATGLVTVDEAENLKSLSVELQGCSPEQASALLGDRELGRVEDGHAWLRIGALRAIARPPRSCTWDERFQRAMAYAQRSGWTDPAGDVVRAHIEASPRTAETPAHGTPPTASPPTGRPLAGTHGHGIPAHGTQTDGTQTDGTQTDRTRTNGQPASDQES